MAVGMAIFLPMKALGVSLYFKYCVNAVNKPIIMATKTCIWLCVNSASSGWEKAFLKILFKKLKLLTILLNTGN